ncbi:MAG TPA: M81 family metallopeptidase [Pirellulaceae bacterium]|nr:M81 family metallopeptidase [Pirellulaceae bacterium]
MRIAAGGILHETSTFLPFPTSLADFEQGFGLYRGAEIPQRFRGANMCIGGFFDAAEECGFEIVPILWGFAYPSGVISRQDYETIKAEFIVRLAGATAMGSLDGVLLDLHGAMVVEGLEDGDGDMVASVRAAIGPDRPIVVTYDLHGNHTAQRMQRASASIGYDTYPHVDMAERGREAGKLIARAVRGEVRPVTALKQIPLFWSSQRQVTAHEPMNEVLLRIHELESRPGILSASIATGFPWADVPQLGASVFVVADGDERLAQRSADELGEWIWQNRERWQQPPPTIREGLAAGERDGRYPIILGDFNDNTGGGAPGDSTAVLRTFLELNLQDALLLYLVDVAAAERAHQAGTGAKLKLALGGKSHPAQGEPVELEVEVMALSDGTFRYDGPMYAGLTGNMGQSAWLRYANGDGSGVSIVVVSKREQPLDPAFARSLGIDCAAMKYIAVKSAVHFRSGFEALAGSIHLVDAPAIHSHRFQTLQYHRRPKMYPLER